MKEIIRFVIEYFISYALVFLLYILLFVRKKTKFDKNRVPIEYFYLISLYKIKEKDINYKKFIYATAFINTFIIVTTYMLVTVLLNKWIWQLLSGIVIIALLIIICYGVLGRYYKKRGNKNV